MKASLPLLIAAQLAGVAGAFATMALWPPAHGAMLLVPVGASPAQVIDAALAGRAAVLARGPAAGWIVVRGDRARLATAIAGRAIVLLAAPPALCGAIDPT